jgi:hypothetical protein
MKGDVFEATARYASQLARAMVEPKVIKVNRSWPQQQGEKECSRRRRFYERHGYIAGGGPLWENDPRNPHRIKGPRVGTVIIHD